MSIKPIIRPVTPQDLEALADMVRHLARFHGDVPSVTTATLARDCLGQAPWLHVLVAEVNEALCGYAMLFPLARAQHGERGMDLHHLYVHKGLRGLGIGRALVRASEALAARLNARFLTVSAVQENDVAGQTYLSLGFEEAPNTARRFRRELPG
ncbi:GNAT family N-acetyltransferase [Nioella aestuarii]|uniref:GNAT family N-acetyltransferase n=1 Tax=Nioella aestuarii TaxID=1662864 RepID=UPI003D7F7161